MSIQAMAWVFDHSTAQGLDRLCLLSIANHAGETNYEAWPSLALIAREAGCQVAVAQRTVSALHRDGHLTRIVNGAPDERIPDGKRPNLYVLTTDQAEIDRLAVERGGNGRRTRRGNCSPRHKVVKEDPSINDDPLIIDAPLATPPSMMTPSSLVPPINDAQDPSINDGGKPSLRENHQFQQSEPVAFGSLSRRGEKILDCLLDGWGHPSLSAAQAHHLTEAVRWIDGQPPDPEDRFESDEKRRALFRERVKAWSEWNDPTKLRERNPLYDAVLIATHKWWEPMATAESKRLATAVAGIHKARGTPEQVFERAEVWHVLYEGRNLTAKALEANWSDLGNALRRKRVKKAAGIDEEFGTRLIDLGDGSFSVQPA